MLFRSVKFPVGGDLPASDPVKQRIADLTTRYQKRYNQAPNQFVAQTYDAIYLAAEALKAGAKDKEKIAALFTKEQLDAVAQRFPADPQVWTALAMARCNAGDRDVPRCADHSVQRSECPGQRAGTDRADPDQTPFGYAGNARHNSVTSPLMRASAASSVRCRSAWAMNPAMRAISGYETQ